ncbi:MAG: FecR domain-containing protein [Filimonas sp.]|nr:FecR domain-containing protein [Filimonas sp.]
MTNENKHPVDWEKVIMCLENGGLGGDSVLLNEEEKKLLEQFLHFRNHLGKVDISFDKQAMLALLNARIEADEAQGSDVVKQASVVKKVAPRRWLYIAAVLIPLIVAGIWFFNREGNKQQVNVTVKAPLQDIKLTLSDGSVVSLGGNKEIKERNGEAVANGDANMLAYDQDNKTSNVMNKLDVPRGRKFSLTLADGSKVWLNAESTISFPIAFKGNTREVVLSGEAYFEVKHDATKPFIVHTGNAQVQVLGTSFDVAAYSNEQMKTTLVEGSVKVSNEKGESIRLIPNEQAVQSAVDNSLKKNTVNIEPIVAWKNNVLAFQNEDLVAIVKRLEREYDYHFVFNNEAVKGIHYTGNLTQANNIETVLSYLSKTGTFRYTIKGREVIVDKE